VVFSSTTFLFVFLPVTFLGLAVLRSRAWQNSWLLGMSIIFYLWGGGAASIVIAYVTLVSFLGGLLPWARWGSTSAVRRVALAAVVGLILMPLLFYKYLPPMASVVYAVLPWSLVLPLGISFFTFHGISYVVDVARSDTLAERNLRDYALYLFVFPHQIAGPIVRYAEIREEIKRPRTAPLDETTLGLARFSWGLTKKVVVADPCGRLADELFAISAAGGDLSAADAWLAAALFTVQIYFDFSGYSDMAVGMAMMMRFHFPENFRQPYRSISVTDFWRRWHITLSRWFRDYVYIPLGGNRHGALRATAALLTVFLLTSLWHGAAWTFLVWGGMHSAFLVIERVTGLRRTSRFAVLRRLAMLIFLVVSWVPFRATSLRALENHWGAMFGGPWTGLGPTALTGITPFVALALVIAIISLFGPRDRTGFGTVFGGRSVTELGAIRWRRVVVGIVLLLGVSLWTVMWSDFSPFLYFQF